MNQKTFSMSRLKWGFIPRKRIVEDDAENDDELIGEREVERSDEKEANSIKKTEYESSSSLEKQNVSDDQDITYEYRDEKGRKWWKFF